MIKILLVVLLTIWVSTTFGTLIIEKLNLGRFIFSAPLGFTALLFILQIMYYPIQMFNLPSYLIHWSTYLVYTVVLFLSIWRIKSNIHQFLRFDIIWLIAYFIFFIYVFYQSTLDLTYADGQMYLNFIAQNININEVNNFNLWTGLVGSEFVTVYLFQGYYHFAGSFVTLVNGFYNILKIGSIIDTIVVAVWGMGSLYALISGMLIIDMINYIKPRQLTRNIVLFFTLFFTNFYYWKIAFSFYGNTWRSLLMAMMIYIFYRLVNEDNRNYRFALIFVFGAALSASSSSLFIGFSILLGFAYYWFREKNIFAFEDTSIIGIPMVLYVLAIAFKVYQDQLPYLLLISVVYYAFFKSRMFSEYLANFNRFISKHTTFIFLVLIPAIAIIYSLLDMYVFDPYYIWNMNHYFNDHAAYDMVKNYLFIHSNVIDNVLNIFRWFGIIILIFFYNERKGEQYLLRHFLLLAVFFLNPMTTSFISKMFASNVYYRVFESLFNVFTEILLFSYLIDMVWERKLLRYGIISIISFSVLFSHYDSLVRMSGSSLYGFYIKNGQDIDPIYKIKPNELEVIRAFEKEYSTLDDRDDQLTLVSHANGLRTFTPEVYVVFTPRQHWSSWDRIDQEFYQVAHMWQGWEDRPKDIDYSKSCSYLKKYEIDYVINEVWLNYEFNQAINDCTTIIFENYDYKLRKVD